MPTTQAAISLKISSIPRTRWGMMMMVAVAVAAEVCADRFFVERSSDHGCRHSRSMYMYSHGGRKGWPPAALGEDPSDLTLEATYLN